MVPLSTNILKEIKSNPFFLAPMAGVTDKPFRSFMKEMGCGLVTTELVSAKALIEKSSKSLQLLQADLSQRPYGIQIFGEDAESLSTGAQIAESFGPDFIDLNLGCPVNKIVKKGAGAALLKDLKQLEKVLSQMRKKTQLPLSLKIRSGWDKDNLNASEVAHIAFHEGFSWLTLHGRTRAQQYSGKSDWNYIKEVKSKALLPVIGNGDLKTPTQAVEHLNFSTCDGVMIGRGALNNPWIFLEARALLKKEPQKIVKNSSALIQKLQIHLRDFYEDRLFLLQMKKFCSWFSAGYPNSSEFRKNLFLKKEEAEVLDFVQKFFTESEKKKQELTEYEAYLMRGHG